MTKRIFNYNFFKEKYNLEILEQVNSKDFDYEKKKLYQKQIDPLDSDYNFTTFLSLVYSMINIMNTPEMEEYKYEIEKSKEYHSKAWQDKDILDNDMALYFKKRKKTKKD